MPDPAASDSVARSATPAAVNAEQHRPVRIWDLPTRLFHWTLALSVVGSIISGQIGGNALAWHFRLGYLAFTLLLFRLVWGLVGGHWSRFANFLYPPSTVLRYLRGGERPGEHLGVGHNPLGAGSVFALLLVLAVQVGTGLVADDEIASTGPLNKFVATSTGLAATSWHKNGGQWLLLALVALHIGAIVFYRLRKQQDLVSPMVRGDKLLPPGVPAAADNSRTRALALVIFVLAAAVVTWVVTRGG